ncbi:serine proteinase stubble-like [Penaeus monodon]|uniref:serine proteinase stubble-like n=1 Tax=Penaeus monodon TaxID=6687 RepID=UPI0018A7412E|nr:serine proteinase stubble-like [Penaeus monodon]
MGRIFPVSRGVANLCSCQLLHFFKSPAFRSHRCDLHRPRRKGYAPDGNRRFIRMQLPFLLCCTLATATATIILTRAVVPDRVIRLRNLDCASDLGERGVCMFAWHCSASGGTHLATCVDGFFFGSCCRLPAENATEEPVKNKTQLSVTSDPPGIPDAASTIPTTPHTKAKPPLEEPASTSPALPNLQESSATTLPTQEPFTTTLSIEETATTTLPESVETTLSIRDSTTTLLTQELSTTTLATQEPIKTTTIESTTTNLTQEVSTTTFPTKEVSSTTQESPTTILTSQESTTTASSTELPETVLFYEPSTVPPNDETPDENVQIANESQPEALDEVHQQSTGGSQPETTEKGEQETTDKTKPETTTISQQGTTGEIEKEVTGETQQGTTDVIQQETAEMVEQELLKNLSSAHHEDVCGRPFSRNARIVGGNRASFGEWPWQASIRVWRGHTNIHVCGGALLTSQWLVTAAHCIYSQKANQVTVVLGEHDLETVDEPYAFINSRVETVIQHPFFNSRNYEYDIACSEKGIRDHDKSRNSRLRDPVAFQPNILPVCLPKEDDDLVGETGVATGWGRLYARGPLPSVLQKVELPIVSNVKCTDMFLEAGYKEHIPDIFLCAGYKEGKQDTCEGDSGGPLVVFREGVWTLAGISSWGKSCAKPNQPGVYTRVSKFKDFLQRIIHST